MRRQLGPRGHAVDPARAHRRQPLPPVDLQPPQGGIPGGLALQHDTERSAARWGGYTPYKVANILLEFSTSISRTQLRPSYGEGFLGAPLQRSTRCEAPMLAGQGDAC